MCLVEDIVTSGGARVEAISVHPRVWETAVRYVNGDTSRLRIVSHLQVDVIP